MEWRKSIPSVEMRCFLMLGINDHKGESAIFALPDTNV